jgi:hypothetical protein
VCSSVSQASTSLRRRSSEFGILASARSGILLHPYTKLKSALNGLAFIFDRNQDVGLQQDRRCHVQTVHRSYPSCAEMCRANWRSRGKSSSD